MGAGLDRIRTILSNGRGVALFLVICNVADFKHPCEMAVFRTENLHQPSLMFQENSFAICAQARAA